MIHTICTRVRCQCTFTFHLGFGCSVRTAILSEQSRPMFFFWREQSPILLSLETHDKQNCVRGWMNLACSCLTILATVAGMLDSSVDLDWIALDAPVTSWILWCSKWEKGETSTSIALKIKGQIYIYILPLPSSTSHLLWFWVWKVGLGSVYNYRNYFFSWSSLYVDLNFRTRKETKVRRNDSNHL
jgi:hypothetical protein